MVVDWWPVIPMPCVRVCQFGVDRFVTAIRVQHGLVLGLVYLWLLIMIMWAPVICCYVLLIVQLLRLLQFVVIVHLLIIMFLCMLGAGNFIVWFHIIKVFTWATWRLSQFVIDNNKSLIFCPKWTFWTVCQILILRLYRLVSSFWAYITITILVVLFEYVIAIVIFVQCIKSLMLIFWY